MSRRTRLEKLQNEWKPLEWEPRRIVKPGGQGYGWYLGAAWWSYAAPSHPSGPDPHGWRNFVVAYIYQLANGDFLALSYGCHWEGDKRDWSPTHQVCSTLELAMDYCEQSMQETGVVPK